MCNAYYNFREPSLATPINQGAGTSRSFARTEGSSGKTDKTKTKGSARTPSSHMAEVADLVKQQRKNAAAIRKAAKERKIDRLPDSDPLAIRAKQLLKAVNDAKAKEKRSGTPSEGTEQTSESTSKKSTGTQPLKRKSSDQKSDAESGASTPMARLRLDDDVMEQTPADDDGETPSGSHKSIYDRNKTHASIDAARKGGDAQYCAIAPAAAKPHYNGDSCVRLFCGNSRKAVFDPDTGRVFLYGGTRRYTQDVYKQLSKEDRVKAGLPKKWHKWIYDPDLQFE